jgi:hypothetical protein
MIRVAMPTSSLPVAPRCDDETPPDDWLLSDGFNMPVTRHTQRRTDVIQSVFDVRVADTKRDASVLANVALRWDSTHVGVGVDPDVMWLEPALPEGMRSVLTWSPGVSPPRVAVEVVSRDTAQKDYTRGPQKYGASGARELWVFDPEGYGRTEDERGPWTLQVWRQARGGFRCVYRGDGPCRSTELDAWIVVIGDQLRVANDEAGTDLWPTALERAEHERTRAEHERTRAEHERTRAEHERTRAEHEHARANDEAKLRGEADARVRELEAQLRALQSPPRRRVRKT